MNKNQSSEYTVKYLVCHNPIKLVATLLPHFYAEFNNITGVSLHHNKVSHDSDIVSLLWCNLTPVTSVKFFHEIGRNMLPLILWNNYCLLH